MNVKNYRYGVCKAGSGTAYHASTARDIMKLAKAHYTWHKVIFFTGSCELEVYVRPEGFYNYDCGRVSMKYISEFLNRTEA